MTVPQQAVALERRFSGLVTKIEEGNCVLVLGPRIAAPREVTGGDLPIDDYLAARLVEDLGGAEAGAQTLDLRRAIARYQRDRGSSACRSMVQALAGDLDDHTTALHIDLAALPFPLILSATPDRMMANALRAYGNSGVREAYYDYRSSVGSDAPLTECRIDSPPLVYSLFGRHDHPESMVLDENSLLDYLVNITRESPGLPDVVRAKLRLAETVFLFVGFGFTN